jgi:gas vesicle protein
MNDTKRVACVADRHLGGPDAGIHHGCPALRYQRAGAGETDMNGQAAQGHDYRFLVGLAMGGVVGAGLAMWLAPRAAAEIRARAIGTVKDLGGAVSGRYRDARLRVTTAVDGLTRKGQGVRDDVCDTVVRAAQEVESRAQEVQRYATDAKTAPVA